MVRQTLFDPGHGNALQAAVASVFGLPLLAVPNFLTDPAGYDSGMRTFLTPSGFAPRKLLLGGNGEALPAAAVGRLCLLRGKSPRGDHGHVVVARCLRAEKGCTDAKGRAMIPRFKFLRDPHPSALFLDEGSDFGWVLFFWR